MGGTWSASPDRFEEAEDEPGDMQDQEEIKGGDNEAKISELKKMIMGSII